MALSISLAYRHVYRKICAYLYYYDLFFFFLNWASLFELVRDFLLCCVGRVLSRDADTTVLIPKSKWSANTNRPRIVTDKNQMSMRTRLVSTLNSFSSSLI